MQGRRSGLATRLRQNHPNIVVLHCLAHRVKLAFHDAIKKAAKKVYDRVITLLLDIYYLYLRSPKIKSQLWECFKVLEIGVLLPSRVGGTRWLAHLQKTLSNFLNGYPAFPAQLENASNYRDSSGKAEGLAKLAADMNVVSFILILQIIRYIPIEMLQKDLGVWFQPTGNDISKKRHLSLVELIPRMIIGLNIC